MKTLRLEKRADGIAVITFDLPGTKVNILSRESLNDFQDALDQVFRDPSVKGCVVASAKKDCFLAGADLEGISTITHPKDAEKVSRQTQEAFNRIARSPVPFVAAVDGVAMGGGCELALACHARVATENPKTIFSLPEVQLGLLPGAGGTQRLPRLLGLRRALPMILSGSRLRAKKALEQGLIDGIAPASELIEEAVKKAQGMAARKGWREPAKLAFADRTLALPLARKILFDQTRKQVKGKTRGHYPAPLSILKAIEAGFDHGLSRGLSKEAELFGKLVVSPQSKSLVWIFHASNELKKAETTGAKSVKKLAVIGAGLMGQGIVAVSLPLSDVVIKDVSEDSLTRAKSNIDKEKNKSSFKGLSTTTSSATLAGADLVIEAVFEDLALKRKVLDEVEAVIAPDAVFATNTSALPISQIAAEARHPERVLGMHYFSPVQKMPLLEIIAADKTSAQALATAQAYGIAQGKTVIVVKDGPGFYTTRILAPLLNEGMLLLEEGAAIEAVDRAMKNFGFPVGPIVLLDEVGIDVGAHVSKDLSKAFGKRWGKTSESLPKIYAAGFLGKKNKTGFYTPEKKPNTKIYAHLGGAQRKSMDEKEMSARVAMMMVNEAVYCLQEGIISSARDGDIGAIMGLGFPPFLGGPFHYVDSLGAVQAVAKMEALAAKHGSRFTPAPLLEKMAREGKRFY